MGEEVIVCSALTNIVNYHSEILHTQQSSNGATSNPTKESEKGKLHLNHVFLFHQNPVIPVVRLRYVCRPPNQKRNLDTGLGLLHTHQTMKNNSAMKQLTS